MGNGTSNLILAKYNYFQTSGNLDSMTNGNSGNIVYYTYDDLDRLVLENWDDLYYRYYYNANGALAKKSQLAGTSIDAAALYALNYEYDSLGRLIFSNRVDDGDIILRTAHEYDTANRLSKQIWQMGDTTYSEAYQYDADNGLLTIVDGSGLGDYAFTYDAPQLELFQDEMISFLLRMVQAVDPHMLEWWFLERCIFCEEFAFQKDPIRNI